MIVAAMLCNLNWAMNDYGIKEISLDSSILAQSTLLIKEIMDRTMGMGELLVTQILKV